MSKGRRDDTKEDEMIVLKAARRHIGDGEEDKVQTAGFGHVMGGGGSNDGKNDMRTL